jgi:DNA-binding transcriptional LysR family regulator
MHFADRVWVALVHQRTTREIAMRNWDDYRLVLALARKGSVRGAASELGVNHATVSRRLAALAAEIGAPVFERKAGGYAPTALGLDLIEAAERMDVLVRDARRRSQHVRSDMAGRVRVSLPDPILRHLLLDTVCGLARQHEDLDLELQVSFGLADLDAAETDIVVRAMDLPAGHLVGRRLCGIAVSSYAATDYLRATPEADRCWLTRRAGREANAWIANTPQPDAPIGLVIDHLDMLHEAARRGHGMIRGICYIADQEPRLTRLPGARTEIFTNLWILTHPDLRHTPRIREVMRHLADALLANKSLLEGKANRISAP